MNTFIKAAIGAAILSFSAECAVGAPTGNSAAWLDLDIIVNGTVIAPTVGASDAFCASNSSAGIDGYARHSITVAIDGVAGENRLRAQARLNNGGTAGWISDIAWVVYD